MKQWTLSGQNSSGKVHKINSRVYRMAKLEMVVRYRNKGCLRIIETKIMNECLLVNEFGKLCKAQMIVGTEFFKTNTNQMIISLIPNIKAILSFGRSYISFIHLFKCGNNHKVRMAGIFFSWNYVDRSVPSKNKCPELHKIGEEPNATVAEYWTPDDWDITFSGSQSSSHYNPWGDLMARIHYQISIQAFNWWVSDSMTKELWKSNRPWQLVSSSGNYSMVNYRQQQFWKEGPRKGMWIALSMMNQKT